MTDCINLASHSQVALVVKTLRTNAGGSGDIGSIPGPGRSPGDGNGNPLQYSCLGNSMDRGTWWSTVHGGHKESDTAEPLSTHTTQQTLFNCDASTELQDACLLAHAMRKARSTYGPPQPTSPSDPPAHHCWLEIGSNSEMLRHTDSGPRLPGFHLALTIPLCLRIHYLSNGEKSHGLRSQELIWKNTDNSLANRKHQKVLINK